MTESTTNTELLTDQQIAEIARDLESSPLATFPITTEEARALIATVKQLRSELANEKRLRAELKQIAQTGIAEVSSVGTTLGEIALRDFRSRAVDLCNQKAAEWLAASRAETNDAKSNELYAECCAARKLARELEKLT